jgi:hypothetical protein
MRKTFVIVGGLLCLLNAGGLSALGMDRWAALSLIESGDNDAAVGRAGEVTRFQIKPVLWEQFCPARQLGARTNPELALRVARAIMSVRCAEFKRRLHRAPTDFEYYVLWNAPAQVENPNRAVTRRARRFCNLVES